MSRFSIFVTAVVLMVGCAGTGRDELASCEGGECDHNLRAHCEVDVEGYAKPLDIENDYLARVVACEMGSVGTEALRAEAIRARSYIYYVIERERRPLVDGTRDQVITCDADPSEAQIQAVRDTAGMVIRHGGTTVAGFVHTGTDRSPECEGGPVEPVSGQRTTYNMCLTGDDVETAWGGKDPADRGDMSHIGSACLADRGFNAQEILRFYYGADIVVAEAEAACTGNAIIKPESAKTPCVRDLDRPGTSDIGQFCTDDYTCEEICETFLGAEGVSGFCSASCETSCHFGLACVDLGEGEGRCAQLTENVATDEYPECELVPGTEPAVLQTYTGSWESVCAPPALGTSCEFTDGDSESGDCIDINVQSCPSGNIRQYRCPGPSEIRCCEN